MCFNVSKSTNKVQIAKKDIVCWKEMDIVGGKLQTPYQEFVYKKGKLYIRKCLKKDEYKYTTFLYRGFHSYIKRPRWKLDTWEVRKKFIIPKGARYLKNYKEYISNQIIMS